MTNSFVWTCSALATRLIKRRVAAESNGGY